MSKEHTNVNKDKYDDGSGHYKCPDCGFWSTHPLDNHRCWKLPEGVSQEFPDTIREKRIG